MAKKSKLERAYARLLNAAQDFCKADNEVQEARRRWQELNQSHDPVDGICLRDRQGNLTPRSNWCQYCRDFVENSPDYSDALFERRAAKVRMKRAFKDIMAERTRNDGE